MRRWREEKKKQKHVRASNSSSTNMSDPSQFETDMLIVPIIVLSKRWHIGIFSFQKSTINDHHHHQNNNNPPSSSSTAVTSSSSSSRLQSSKMRSDPNEPHIGKYRFSKVTNDFFCWYRSQIRFNFSDYWQRKFCQSEIGSTYPDGSRSCDQNHRQSSIKSNIITKSMFISFFLSSIIFFFSLLVISWSENHERTRSS